MTHVLAPGATGMIGSHLIEALRARGERDILGTSFRPTVPAALLAGRMALIDLDIRDRDAVREAIAVHRPATIHHLAAQSLPTVSWDDPWDTMATNAQGTVNLFEAVRQVRATDDAGYDPMIVVACSSAEYGASLTPENLPVDEDAALLPLHPYGVSKIAQDLLAFQYWRGRASAPSARGCSTPPGRANGMMSSRTSPSVWHASCATAATGSCAWAISTRGAASSTCAIASPRCCCWPSAACPARPTTSAPRPPGASVT